jgi:HEPN domain-containing protein
VNRQEFQQLAGVRLKEARALLQSGHSDGAYYLAGYAVECAIKACIAKETRRHEFPDKRKVDASYSHNLKELIKVAALEGVRSDRAKHDPEFRKCWDTVEIWTERARYQRHSPGAARDLLAAITRRRHGVISWLRLHW